jgi:hypothetical protein
MFDLAQICSSGCALYKLICDPRIFISILDTKVWRRNTRNVHKVLAQGCIFLLDLLAISLRKKVSPFLMQAKACCREKRKKGISGVCTQIYAIM